MRMIFLALSVACALTAGCVRGPTGPPPAKTPEVLVSLPISKEVTDYEDFTGRTEAVAAVEVRARATGYLEKVNFQDGATVTKGDVLFEIDRRPYEAEVNKAASSLVQAEEKAKRLDRDLRRATALLGQKALAQEEFDKITGDANEAKASIGVARANLDLAKLNLSFTKVTAPISGKVSYRYKDPGNLIKADDTLLTTIVTLDPMYAYFDMDERTVLRLRRLKSEGNLLSMQDIEVPFLLGLADEEGFSHQGKINFVDNKIDSGTGTLRVRGIFDNAKLTFTPGLFVRVRLLIGVPRQAVLVAERALGTDQGQKYLYVINDKDEVVYRPVKIGALDDGFRVIESGLAPGEKVLVNGLQRVRPGAKVQPKLVEMTASAVAAVNAALEGKKQ